MKYEGGGQIDEKTEKAILKKPSVIKVNTFANFILNTVIFF